MEVHNLGYQEHIVLIDSTEDRFEFRELVNKLRNFDRSSFLLMDKVSGKMIFIDKHDEVEDEKKA